MAWDDVNRLVEMVPQQKLVPQLCTPLLNQRLRHDHQHPMSVWIIQHVLADEHSGFDRLSESDLIGQEVTLSRITKNSAHDTELMNFQVDD